MKNKKTESKISNENLLEEKFTFVQLDSKIYDIKFETKPIGYLRDAWLRFKKNKASVCASIIIIIIALFSLIVPLVSKWEMGDKDLVYTNRKPYSKVLSNIGIADGLETRNIKKKYYADFVAIGVAASDHDGNGATWQEGLESEYNPIRKAEITNINQKSENCKVKINSYLEVGFTEKTLTKLQMDAILKWERESGVYVIYPMVADISDYNKWYKVDGSVPVDINGNPIDVYSSNVNNVIIQSEYLKNPDGSVAYYDKKDGDQYIVRVLYYNYYRYNQYMEEKWGKDYNINLSNQAKDITGEESEYYYILELYLKAAADEINLKKYGPSYLFGTDSQGYDITVRLAGGIRLSLVLSLVVSAINLVIGAIYGSIEGYYGGWVDMIMERIADILSGIPFIIVATLFQQHLVKTGKVSAFGALIFAFVLTGWISTAYRVRTQFYRFKGQEYVLAARTLGAKDFRLMYKHIFPNTLGTLITASVLIIPTVIFSESMLSYLGIVDLQGTTATSIGTMLSNGRQVIKDFPHVIFFPAIVISLLMISFNLFGNGLRDAFNPSLRGVEE